MLRLWFLIGVGLLCGCSRAPASSGVEKRQLTPAERVEANDLISTLQREYDKDGEDGLVGKTRSDFPKLFELADAVGTRKDGTRVYAFHLRDERVSQDGTDTFYITTDGGRSQSSDASASSPCETILETYALISAN